MTPRKPRLLSGGLFLQRCLWSQRAHMHHRIRSYMQSTSLTTSTSSLRSRKWTNSARPQLLATGLALIGVGTVMFLSQSRVLLDDGKREPVHVKFQRFREITSADRASKATAVDSKLSDIERERQTQQRPADDPASETSATTDGETTLLPWITFTDSLSLAANAFASINFGGITSVFPEWALSLPDWVNKLQRELNMEPGSLAEEIWLESKDPRLNPEIQWDAKVRISEELCDEEKAYLKNRRQYTKRALAAYLNIPEQDIHDEDVPVIAITGSGGGLRAMVAGAGSLEAAKAAGLFDCTTYMVGVSGSCWLMSAYFTVGHRNFTKVIEHLKGRLGVHIAYPPAALDLLNCAPTNKYLLRGVVERLKQGYATFGLVDVYGLLLAARLMVPSNELNVKDEDLKLSAQRRFTDSGEQPLAIYTAVRHEIPGLGGEGEKPMEKKGNTLSDGEAKEQAKQESWFEWAEMTCYELFIEEAGAGIPTWAMGRRFHNGVNDVRIPEMKLPILLGLWGSAFCATLSHYFQEARPIFSNTLFFSFMDRLVQDRNDDLIKVHPIVPAGIPNYLLGLRDRLPTSCAESMHTTPEIQLMDAGMSNNLATYPLFRPGRNVDIVICFDASAEIKTANWLSMTEGYTKQRGLKGWPVGIGWPSKADPHPEDKLEAAQAQSADDALDKLTTAQKEDPEAKTDIETTERKQNPDSGKGQGLGPLTIWCGSREEKTYEDEPPRSKAIEEDWELMLPEAGITVAYFPLIPNPAVPGVDPETSPFLSTWNFEYTHQDVDNTVKLARENFKSGQEKMKRTVKAVYMRKKKVREEIEEKEREEWGVRRSDYDLLVSGSA